MNSTCENLFKTMNRLTREKKFWLFIFGFVVVLLSLVELGIFPSRARTNSISQAGMILSNLRQIEGAKEQWSLDQKATGLVEIPSLDIAQYLKGSRMPNAAGEVYVINPAGVPPVAVLIRRLPGFPEGTILRIDGEPILQGGAVSSAK